MKRIAVCLVALGLLVGMYATAFAAYGPDDLTVLSVGSYAREREVRLLGGWWMYRYKMNVTSTGKLPLAGVCGQVRSSSSSVKVIDPEVCFPEIPAGGSATSKGTFTIWTNKRLSGSPTNLSWIYSSLKITADPSPLAIQKAAPYNALSYYVTLSTSAPKKYYVLFHQAVPEGITITEQSLLTREMNQAGTWRVTEFVSAPVAMESDITARAWILNTLQQAEVTVPVSVTPTPPPPQLGILRSWPPALGLDTPTDVSFTIAVSGVSLPASLDLQQQISGAWQSIGALTDSGQDGDVHQGDGIYAGVVRGITASQEGTLMFRAVAPTGISAPYALTVTSYPTVASDETRQVITLSSGQSVVGNRILVNFLPGITRGEIESTLVPVSGTVVNFLGSVNAYQVEIATANEADLFAAIATLKSSPRVVTAEPVVVLRVAAPYVFINKDTYYDPGNEPNFTPPSHQGQWDMKAIKADEAWTISKGANVTIAVLDTGVDANHEDLSGQVMARIDKTGSVIQGSHGTGVAGIIAAKGDNGKGIAGMAWESKIVDFQVCKNDSDCDVTWVIPALAEATSAPYHAKVINMSLYFTTEPTIPGNGINLSTAISDAAKNAIIVVAAGNANNNAPTYPGAYGDPIAVTASKEDGTLLGGSTFGDWVDLAAPGSNIVTLKRVSGTFYYAMQPGSTSYAAPHVSGAAALLWAYQPQWSSNTIRSRLLLTAHHPDPNNHLPVRYGMLDAHALLGPYDPGTIDTSFGNNGVVTDPSASGGRGKSVTLDSMGRILVTGFTSSIGGDRMTIWCYTDYGEPDDTFGDDDPGTGKKKGYAFFDSALAGFTSTFGWTIAIDSAGRILVAGYGGVGGSYYMVIWRYTKDGDLDETFGDIVSGTLRKGFAVHNNAAGGSGPDFGNSIVLDSTGRILVAGSSGNSDGNMDMVIWRYLPNGTLDRDPATGFGQSDGAYRQGFSVDKNIAGGNGNDSGNSIAIDASGRIFVAGSSANAAGRDEMALWVYDQNGTLLHSMTDGGTSDTAWYAGMSLALDRSGHVFVAGYELDTVSKMVVWRCNLIDGSLDTTFGTAGKRIYWNTAGGNDDDFGWSITVDSSDMIVVAGASRNGKMSWSYDMVIWRLDHDGTPDPLFAKNGAAIYDGSQTLSSDDFANSVAIDPAGLIVATGVSRGAMTLWRYLP